MDLEQDDLQFLGFFGIFKESFRLIFSRRKIFTKITLAFILPLSCINLANIVISKFISNKFIPNKPTLEENVSTSISKEWITYWLIYGIFSLIFSLILSFLSVTTIVYTIDCIYMGKEINFKQVVSVVPKVWKRFMITFLSFISTIFVYTFVFLFAISLIGSTLFFSNYGKFLIGLQLGVTVSLFIMVLLFLVGIIWMCIIWQLAYVISILEKICGIQAMTKSKKLLKGKIRTATAILLVLSVCSTPNQIMFKQIGKNDGRIGCWEIVCYGIVSLVWMTFYHLLSNVVQTVLYFVCKAYHHEDIEKSFLVDHIKVFTGDYVPLNAKDVQKEHLNV